MKRIFDFSIALLLTVCVLSWLIPLIALIIKLDSRGPVFFFQKRVGYMGRSFRCIKLRTMYVNALADVKQAAKHDKRITRVGRFLRDTGLDELPQFINVLIGQMSIIGPRPHMHADAANFSAIIEDYKFRNLAKPGITGMAQVKGCRGTVENIETAFRRYQWDCYYVRNRCGALDFKILRKTALLIIRSLLYKNEALPAVTTQPGKISYYRAIEQAK